VVIPGLSYHLKIAIADLTDGNFDSAVFLPEGAIRCTDLSTSIAGIDANVPRFWLNDRDGTIQVRGLDDGPASLEWFDTAGRLVQRLLLTRDGAFHSAPFGNVPSGLSLLRATQAQRVLAGKVFVP